GLDQEVPYRFKFLPSAGVSKMLQLMNKRIMSHAGLENIAPPVKLLIGPPVAAFEFLRGHAFGLVNHAAGVIFIPVAVQYPSFSFHLPEQFCSRVGRQDMVG